eukprot:s2897_g5.t1
MAAEWRCGWCKKTCKWSANNCSHCGGGWENADPSYVPQKNRKKQKANAGQWDTWGAETEAEGAKSPRTPKYQEYQDWNQTPKSPRSKGKKGQSKGRGKSKGKGKKAPAGDSEESQRIVGYTHGGGKGPPPEPPWHPSIPAAQALSPLPPPTAPPPLTPAELRLQAWVAEMQKEPQSVQENLTPEMQALMQGMTLEVGQKAAKTLDEAVADLKKAREALDKP